LQSETKNGRAGSSTWIEAAVQTPVGIQARDPIAAGSIDARKIASNQHFTIRSGRRMQVMSSFAPAPGSKTRVETAVIVDPRNPGTVHTVETRKAPPIRILPSGCRAKE
jgi:hypothetical protein